MSGNTIYCMQFQAKELLTLILYPYFCVELQKKNGQYVFVENHRPVVVIHSLHGIALNLELSNFHMIAFCWQDNWIVLDVFHGMTDGTGAYEIVGLCMIFRMSINWSFQILNFLGQDNKFRFMEEYTEDLFVEYMPLIEVEDGFVQSG